jgi:negative regulator of flagellin synthesis FlgM
MRISNEQAQILAAQKLKAARGVSESAAVGKASEATAVSMSTMGQTISKALGALGAMPDVRADRVAALKAQIASGEYQVSGRDVAESMLRRAADQQL